MKIRNKVGTALILAWVVALVLTACSSPVAAQGGPATGSGNNARSGGRQGFGTVPRAGEQGNAEVDRGASEPFLAEMPVGELNDVEAEGLLYMREEEKLARDVYLALYEQWGMQVFSNIADSEATHMEALKTLLDRYGLADPVEGKVNGEFANEELQALCDQLVVQGSESLVEALNVGAAIEEIDILDLDKSVAQTDKADIQRVYDNLTRGSRNHLRAFVSSLERQGVQYERAYLSPEAYDEIVNAETERGGGQGNQGSLGSQGSQGSQGARGGQSGRGGRGRHGRQAN
jgi:hypothetical protein